MGFVEKVKQAVSGRTETERRQEVAAMAEIRRKALAARLRERETQAIKFAAEEERVAYDKRIKALKSKPSGSGFFSGFQRYYGTRPPQRVGISVPKRVKRKGKKKKHRVQYQRPQRYDVLGSSF